MKNPIIQNRYEECQWNVENNIYKSVLIQNFSSNCLNSIKNAENSYTVPISGICTDEITHFDWQGSKGAYVHKKQIRAEKQF